MNTHTGNGAVPYLGINPDYILIDIDLKDIHRGHSEVKIREKLMRTLFAVCGWQGQQDRALLIAAVGTFFYSVAAFAQINAQPVAACKFVLL